jgi:nucleotidyltransferase/DNA polymerase involved in DNA repair
VKRFGKTGVWLWGVANGLERIAVNEKAMRSISVEHTFDKDVADKQEVVAKIVELSDRLHKRVLSSKTSFRVVGIKIRFTHFQTYTRENTLSSTTSSREELLREAKNLFREFEKSPRKVRLIGLFVSSLSESETNENLESWVQ